VKVSVLVALSTPTFVLSFPEMGYTSMYLTLGLGVERGVEKCN